MRRPRAGAADGILRLLSIPNYIQVLHRGGMVRQKTISLDEKTAIIAGRMPNFSKWVRLQLISHARSAKQASVEQFNTMHTHTAPTEARVWGPMNDKCNPRHKDGVCENCYPDGVDA